MANQIKSTEHSENLGCHQEGWGYLDNDQFMSEVMNERVQSLIIEDLVFPCVVRNNIYPQLTIGELMQYTWHQVEVLASHTRLCLNTSGPPFLAGCSISLVIWSHTVTLAQPNNLPHPVRYRRTVQVNCTQCKICSFNMALFILLQIPLQHGWS